MRNIKNIINSGRIAMEIFLAKVSAQQSADTGFSRITVDNKKVKFERRESGSDVIYVEESTPERKDVYTLTPVRNPDGSVSVKREDRVSEMEQAIRVPPDTGHYDFVYKI